MDTLYALGWNERFAGLAKAAALKLGLDESRDLFPLRVAVVYGKRAACLGDRGEYSVEAAGALRRELEAAGSNIVTGDWLLAEARAGRDGTRETDTEGRPMAMARALLPRATDFARKEPVSGGRRVGTFEGREAVIGGRTVAQSIAANVDRIFVVMAPGPGSTIRTVERYLAVVRASGADPVVVLNKADIVADPEAELAALRAVARGAKVLASCALDGRGVDRLKELTGPGLTVALVGKSGVGKSALVNALLGTDRQDTGAISGAVGKGMHTTTARELLPLPEGGMLVDTPGMREFQLWGDDGMLSAEFDDIAELASRCRFSDCRHEDEPGCAVAEAISAGALALARLESYHKLRRELSLLATRKRGLPRKRPKPELGF